MLWTLDGEKSQMDEGGFSKRLVRQSRDAKTARQAGVAFHCSS